MRFTSTAAAAALLAGCATVPDAAAPPISVARGPLPASVTSELPRNARPTHYAIEVAPDAQRLTFTGFTAIDLELFETSRAITLNAIKLDLAKATLTPLAGGTATPMAISLDEAKETATFTAPTDLAPGKYQFSIKLGGRSLKGDEVEIGPDETWGIVVGPGAVSYTHLTLPTTSRV